MSTTQTWRRGNRDLNREQLREYNKKLSKKEEVIEKPVIATAKPKKKSKK